MLIKATDVSKWGPVHLIQWTGWYEILIKATGVSKWGPVRAEYSKSQLQSSSQSSLCK